jgi:hypothetical protein
MEQHDPDRPDSVYGSDDSCAALESADEFVVALRIKVAVAVKDHGYRSAAGVSLPRRARHSGDAVPSPLLGAGRT